MQRSAGVTVSAVVVFIGCGLTLLGVLSMVATMFLAPAPFETQPMARVGVGMDVVLGLGFAAWGIATGIGLLNLKEWARISMIVYNALLILFCVVPMLIVPIVPMATSDDLPTDFRPIFITCMEGLLGVFVVIGVCWIIYFCRKSVKAQFRPQLAGVSGALVGGQYPFAGAYTAPIPPAVLALVEESGPKRPILISIIAVLMLVGGVMTPLVLLMHTPVVMFGVALHGAGAAISTLLLCGLNVAAGVGLLQMRRWGWAIALAGETIGAINVACMIIAPGALDMIYRYQAQQYSMPDAMDTEPFFQSIMRFSLGFGILFAMAMIAALVKYRKAFGIGAKS